LAGIYRRFAAVFFKAKLFIGILSHHLLTTKSKRVSKKTKLKVTAEVKNTTAKIRITSRIAEYTDSSALNIKGVIDSLVAQGIKEANVYINSNGGSVFEATEIANELKRFEKVNLTVGALAASAATYPVAKYPTSAFLNSQFMIHYPRLGTYGTVKEVEADLKLLKNITSDYIQVYADKTGKPTSEMEELLNKGDYWMTAKEALAIGLIDEIIDEEEKPTAESILVLEACGAPHIPKLEKQPEHNNTMDKKELIASLGLAADATDEQIKQRIADNKVKAESADQLQLQAQAEANKKANAEALVNQAIIAKKITAQQKVNYIPLAEADYNSTKAILDALPAIEALSGQLTPKTPVPAVDTLRADWTLQDYIDKDPAALSKMETENPQAFLKLNEAYYGK
jgi:ATP-dependent protease ClpP protease subunit